MKTTVLTTFCAFAPLVQVLFSAPVPAMRDAATHEQLVIKYRKIEQSDPMARLQPAKGPDPSLSNQSKDLVGSSDIICFNGAATLVPKRAILSLPKSLEGRLKFAPGSRINSWAAFFAVNQGWISTVEVTRAQAEGNSAIDPKTLERMGKSSNLVVAVYQGGPISVLPLKAKDAATTLTPKP
jgi:hypothetical protein